MNVKIIHKSEKNLKIDKLQSYYLKQFYINNFKQKLLKFNNKKINDLLIFKKNVKR